LVGEIEDKVFEYLQTDKILIQSNIYLRASRPGVDTGSESIGWHRETFYGPNLQRCINCWTPVKGVNSENTLRFIPRSQLIPDNEISVEKVASDDTQKFSSGHKLGFQYAPKKIRAGVDMDDPAKLLVQKGASALFSGNLIHGAAVNNSNNIRFSVDLRLIRKADYGSENKRHHFSSSKPYFVEYQS